MNKRQAIACMNQWGKQRTPFVFLIDFELRHPLVWQMSHVPTQQCWFNFNDVSNVPAQKPSTNTPNVLFNKYPIAFELFERSFAYVQAQLSVGNTFLLNLTAPTRIKTNLSLQEIYRCSRAKYKVWFSGVFGEFVCFSPEIFVQIHDGWIASYPMKGTIDASLPNAQAQLLTDPKELFEHATIVDLIRNDLAMICTQRSVARFRYIEEVPTHDKTLLQVSSEIRGKLPSGWQAQIGTLLCRLLPAGSVSGAPKPSTLRAIAIAEGQPRGYYTGICGYFDGTNLDSGVMIRFIEHTPKGVFFRSGGGITFRSQAHKEYQELIDKVYVPIY